jgi:fatty-acyl-CoA synthase
VAYLLSGLWAADIRSLAIHEDPVSEQGWSHTCDMATIDDEGYIQIADRKKDIIISGGENISSLEVERALYSHPAVLEAAVISVPHGLRGEVPKVIVCLKSRENAGEEEVAPSLLLARDLSWRQDPLPFATGRPR